MIHKSLLSALLAFAALTLQAQDGLKDAIGQRFLIGTSLNAYQASGQDGTTEAIVRQHFNAVVAENAMKSEALQPQQGMFTFKQADEFVDFAERNHLAAIGHCLVWHSQMPAWFTVDKEGKTVSREELIKRIRQHIATVVGRYKGRIKGWDVVNEAIEDDGSMRRSPLYNIIGEDFIEIAFRAAHEADPEAELYYNDYSMAGPRKREAVCRMVRRLKAKGVRIDAVGMQSHNGLDYPNLKEYEASIDSFAACGVKVMATELDINVLPSPEGFSGADINQNFELQAKLNPYPNGLTKQAQKEFEQRYLDIFDIYRRHAHQISRVTLWGVTDAASWLNDWPVHGRTNYPMLFGRDNKAKPVVRKIMKMFSE